MAKKSSLKKRVRPEEIKEIVEDLDLDVDDYPVADEDLVHNRRRKPRKEDDDEEEDELTAVLPSDAHKLEGYDDDDDERGAHIEEEALARAANKSMRRQVVESDFDVGDIVASAKPKKRLDEDSSNAFNVTPVIEAIERDYAALSSSERLAIVQKESPEMIKIMEELKQHLAEVRELAKPLQELFFQRRVAEADRSLVQFLETKVQLMLSYCMHAVYYLLLKAEGKKVAGHPVIDNLVEIRVYLEKLFPLEEKLQYSLNRLLSGKSTSAAQLDTLRPLQHGERGALGRGGPTSASAEGKKSRSQLAAMRQAEAVERAELATMNRMRTKAASALRGAEDTDRAAATSALGYHEDEDQYFARLTHGAEEEEEEGLSLMERLRRRQRAAGAIQTEGDDEDDGAFGEEAEADLLSDGEDGEGDYETLLAEEKRRRRRDDAAQAEAEAKRPKFVEEEMERRKAGKRIEAHRGLTRPRPKDRKTPRTAQRRKYEKGMRIHKAQSKTVVPEPEGGFVGVSSIKSRVTKSTRL